MKKLLPIFIMLLSFSGFITIQLLVDIFDTKALTPTANQSYAKGINDVFTQTVFNNLQGEIISLPKVNAPVIILEFSATWCAPCKKQIPRINSLLNKYPDHKLQIFSFYSEEDLTPFKLLNYGKLNQINFPLILDEKGTITNLFRITKVPSFLVFVNGELVQQYLGDELNLSVLDKLMK